MGPGPHQDYFSGIQLLEDRVAQKTLARRNRAGQFDIGGPLDRGTHEGQLDLLYDFMPWRAVGRLGDTAEDLQRATAAAGGAFTPMSPEQTGMVGLDALDALSWGALDIPQIAGAAYRHGVVPAAQTVSKQGAEVLQALAENAARSPLAGQYGIVGYHGSPYKFDQFDHSQMGSGEGAQAYGWGTYIAESPDVAMSYTARDFDLEDQLYALYKRAEQGQDYESMEVLEQAMMHDTPEALRERFGGRGLDDVIDSVEGLYRRSSVSNLYDVDIPDSKIAQMLDWDAPLSEQPESVREALVKAYRDSPDTDYIPKPEDTGQDLYGGLNVYGGNDTQKQVSEYLHSHGIPGIKYFDGNSRGAGEGTRNFVVFDENDMTVLKRDGEQIPGDWAPPAPAEFDDALLQLEAKANSARAARPPEDLSPEDLQWSAAPGVPQTATTSLAESQVLRGELAPNLPEVATWKDAEQIIRKEHPGLPGVIVTLDSQRVAKEGMTPGEYVQKLRDNPPDTSIYKIGYEGPPMGDLNKLGKKQKGALDLQALADASPMSYTAEDLAKVPDVPQVPMERFDAPKGKPKTLKGLLGKRTENRMSDYAKAGADKGGLGWYNLDPIRERFVEELGEVEGNAQFKRYTEFLAATSPREKVKQNVKRGGLFHYLDRKGDLFAHLRNPGKGSGPGDEIPPGYGSLGHETQRHLLADLEGGGSFSSMTRPKTSSFAENLAGNQTPITIDTHNMMALTGGKMKRSPSAGEYKYIEQFESEIADKIGMTPAQFQSSVWVGAGGDTGVADVRPFVDVFNTVVKETAEKRKITPAQALKQFIKGEKPLLGLAAALSSATILDQQGEQDGN